MSKLAQMTQSPMETRTTTYAFMTAYSMSLATTPPTSALTNAPAIPTTMATLTLANACFGVLKDPGLRTTPASVSRSAHKMMSMLIT